MWCRYGGRGIKICPEWDHPKGHVAFISWALANGWAEGLQIDRADNNGGYSPENCRFVTLKENLKNREVTPKWRAAMERFKAAGEKARHKMTPRKLEAMRSNMAKAREALRLKRDAAKANAA